MRRLIYRTFYTRPLIPVPKLVVYRPIYHNTLKYSTSYLCKNKPSALLSPVESTGRFYEQLRANQIAYKQHLLMARVGDFYEFYFDQAELVSRACGLKLAQGKYRGEPHVFCGFPAFKMHDYVRMLLRHGYTVAKYEQYERQQINDSKLLCRKVDRIFSNGTAIEEDLLAEDSATVSNNYIAAVSPIATSSNHFSVAAIDLASGKFIVDHISSEHLFQILSSIPLSEVLVPSNSDYSLNIVKPIASRLEVNILPVDPTSFSPEFGWQCLHRIFSPDSPTQSLAEKSLTASLFPSSWATSSANSCPGTRKFPVSDVMQTVGALLQYVVDSHGGILPFLERPQVKFDYKHRLKIDQETERSLEIIVSNRDRLRKGTLLQCIDKTITPVGKKELLERLRAPFNSRPLIESHLELVEFLIRDLDKSERLKRVFSEHFNHDAIRSLQNLKLNHGGLWHLGSVYEAILGFKEIQMLCSQDNTRLPKLITSVFSLESKKEQPFTLLTNPKETDRLGELIELLEAVLPIDYIKRDMAFMSLPKKLEGVGNLNPSCNDDLQKAARIYKHSLSKRENLELHIKNAHFEGKSNVNIKLMNKKPLGPIIEIEAGHEDLDTLEGSNEFIRLQALKETSNRGRRRYKYTKWSQLEQDVAEAYAYYSHVEMQAFLKVSECLQGFRDELKTITELVALLDVSLSFAVKARESNYVKPVMIDEEQFMVLDGRHPIVENALETQLKHYRPTSCKLGYDTQMAFITGPNMGGKSTYLRMNALMIVLSHIGCFVPASKAEIGIVDQLFSRVGTSDNLAQNESSFMVEMKETAHILNQATGKSFAILDEVGRGTSYEDGISLAKGIVDYLVNNIGCRAMFATHFTELGRHFMNHSRVEPLRSKIVFQNGRMDCPMFTYQFERGVATDSFGLFVARVAGIPEKVLNDAVEYKEKICVNS